MAAKRMTARQDAHASLISRNPRGDDQIHLIDFLRSASELATSSEGLLLRLRKVLLAKIIAKKLVTKTPNIFLAIRQLLMEYGVQVRRATGLPIIQGVLDAIFEHGQEAHDDSVKVWKTRVSEKPLPNQDSPANNTTHATKESR
jgi:hypothetical protein